MKGTVCNEKQNSFTKNLNTNFPASEFLSVYCTHTEESVGDAVTELAEEWTRVLEIGGKWSTGCDPQTWLKRKGTQLSSYKNIIFLDRKRAKTCSLSPKFL